MEPNIPARRRRHSRSQAEALSSQERAVIAVMSVLITWSFWSFGGRPPLSLFVFSTLGFLIPLVAILPPWGRPKEFVRAGLKSPFFWVSLIALSYPIIQALNPSHTATLVDGTRPIVTPREHISWLPSGVQAPWEIGSSWRHVLMFGSLAAAFVTLRLVLTQRKSWLILLWVTLINGSLMAFIGTLVELSDTRKIFWVFPSPNPSFFGSFTYKNHASCALYLTVALGWVLYFFHARQTKMKAMRSGPHIFCLLLVLLTALPVFMTGSKAGMLLVIAICVLCAGLWLIAWLANMRDEGNLGRGIAILIVGTSIAVSIASVFGQQLVDLDDVSARLIELEGDLEVISEDQVTEASRSNKHRFIAMIAFYQMLRERPILGVGAGSFEHFSIDYSIQYPDIHYSWFSRKEGGWRTWHWRDAHSDWLEFPIEYGWLGFGLLLAMLAVWLPGFMGVIQFPRAYLIAPWIGAGAMIGHAIIEFVFQTPSLVLIFLMLWTSPWFFQNLKRA